MEISELFSSRFFYKKETGQLFWNYCGKCSIRWNKRYAGTLAGCVNNIGYRRINLLGKWYLAHRIIFYLEMQRFPQNQIDHIDGKRDNNKISNLRECTNRENSQNKSIGKKNTSGFLGVSFHKRANKWQANIGINGTTKYLGSFDNPISAYGAYLLEKSKNHYFQPIPRFTEADELT